MSTNRSRLSLVLLIVAAGAAAQSRDFEGGVTTVALFPHDNTIAQDYTLSADLRFHCGF